MASRRGLLDELDEAIAGGDGGDAVRAELSGAEYDALTLKAVRAFARRRTKRLNERAGEDAPGVAAGTTPLQHLILSLNGADELLPCVEAFLQHGARPEVCDANGRNALVVHVAECVPSPALVARLLAAAPDLARGRDRQGAGALHALARNAAAVPHGGGEEDADVAAAAALTPDGLAPAAAVAAAARLLAAAGAPGWNERDRFGDTPRALAEANPNRAVRAALLVVAAEDEDFEVL